MTYQKRPQPRQAESPITADELELYKAIALEFQDLSGYVPRSQFTYNSAMGEIIGSSATITFDIPDREDLRVEARIVGKRPIRVELINDHTGDRLLTVSLIRQCLPKAKTLIDLYLFT